MLSARHSTVASFRATMKCRRIWGEVVGMGICRAPQIRPAEARCCKDISCAQEEYNTSMTDEEQSAIPRLYSGCSGRPSSFGYPKRDMLHPSHRMTATPRSSNLREPVETLRTAKKSRNVSHPSCSSVSAGTEGDGSQPNAYAITFSTAPPATTP